jgi:hypothetical protein
MASLVHRCAMFPLRLFERTIMTISMTTTSHGYGFRHHDHWSTNHQTINMSKLLDGATPYRMLSSNKLPSTTSASTSSSSSVSSMTERKEDGTNEGDASTIARLQADIRRLIHEAKFEAALISATEARQVIPISINQSINQTVNNYSSTDRPMVTNE